MKKSVSWFLCFVVIAAVIAAIIFCTRSCKKQNNPAAVTHIVDSISKDRSTILETVDSITQQRDKTQIIYRTKIIKEYEKILAIDTLPICAVADSIAKYYQVTGNR